MHSDHEHNEIHHHKPRHLAERFEGWVSVMMVIAIVLLAIGLVYGIMTTDSTPSWMR
jgi:hypothetical protein